jgi:hypothetical protein
MQTRKYRSLGFTVEIEVPSTVEENDQLAGRPNATLEDAVDNVVYRGALALPTFRRELAAGLEQTTGIKRKFEVVMTKAVAASGTEGQPGYVPAKPSVPKVDDEGNEVTKWTESEADYLDRVLAETGRTLESFADVAAAAATKMKYDPKVKEREEAGPKTPPKSVYAQVDALINAGAATQVAESLTAILGRQVATDRDSLARAIHEDALNEIRKVKNKFAVTK